MSKTDNQSREKTLSKDLQIVAYLKAEEGADIREVCTGLCDDTDYTETYTEEMDHYVMFIGDGFNYIDESEYEEALGNVSGPVSVHEFTEEKESHENNKSGFSRQMRHDVVGDVSFGNENKGIEERWGRKAQIDGRTVFSIMAQNPTHMGLLKHQSEIDGDDVWEDQDAELPAVVFNIDIDKCSPSVYRWFDNKVIPEIVENIAKHDWVSRHRVMDCEREISEEGVCYGI